MAFGNFVTFRILKKALYSFLDMIFGGREIALNITPPMQAEPERFLCRDGFLSASDVDWGFGLKLEPAHPGQGIHLVDVLCKLATPKAWRCKAHEKQFGPLLQQIGLAWELGGLETLPYCHLRKLPKLYGPKGLPRTVSDVFWKDEMMQTAKRAGASLTASRLHRALLAADEDEDAVPVFRHQQKAPSAAGSSTDSPAPAPVSSPAGHATLIGALAPEKPAQTDVPPVRDQTQYEWPVMCTYNHSGKAQFPHGPVCIHFDGVNTVLSGELNQYIAIAPARPREAIREIGVILPIQEY